MQSLGMREEAGNLARGKWFINILKSSLVYFGDQRCMPPNKKWPLYAENPGCIQCTRHLAKGFYIQQITLVQSQCT